MKKILFIYLLISSITSYGQKIRFEYDSAGNQVLRTWCTTCPSKNSNQPLKDISKIEDSDYEKFFHEDVISYYPNPVREELYLRWDLIDDNKVSSIEIFFINGQL